MPKNNWEEAKITIDGIPISQGMAMTIRVALQNFAMDLQANGLGNDETGKSMTNNYLNSIREINKIILK